MNQPDIWTSLSNEVALLHRETSILQLFVLLFLLFCAAWAGRVVRTAVRWLWTLQLDSGKRLAALGTIVQVSIACFAGARLIAHGLRTAPGVTLLILLVAAPTSGLLLRAPLQNIMAGLSLLLQRRIREGDDLRLGDGRQGRVSQIRLSSTLAIAEDSTQLIIPNAELLSSVVQKLPPQPGVQLTFSIPGPRVSDIAALQAAHRTILFSPYRASHSLVSVSPATGGSGLDISLRVISNSAKQAAALELSRKIPQSLGWLQDKEAS